MGAVKPLLFLKTSSTRREWRTRRRRSRRACCNGSTPLRSCSVHRSRRSRSWRTGSSSTVSATISRLRTSRRTRFRNHAGQTRSCGRPTSSACFGRSSCTTGRRWRRASSSTSSTLPRWPRATRPPSVSWWRWFLAVLCRLYPAARQLCMCERFSLSALRMSW
jgi:hypothetical protein